MASVDAIMNRVIDHMGSVPDCDVVRVCVAFNTTERIGVERFAAFFEALPKRQDFIHKMIEQYYCPECDQGYASAQAINADGSVHRRCPYCGREW